MNTAAANDPTAALWETLRDFIVQAFSLFDAPHEIAQFGVRLRKEHAQLLHYLRQCETLLRKLLFIEALALAPSLGAPRLGRQKSQRKRRLHEQDPAGGGSVGRKAHDEGGGVASLFPPPAAPSVTLPRDSSPVNGGAKRFVSTWPQRNVSKRSSAPSTTPRLTSYVSRTASRATPNSRGSSRKSPCDATTKPFSKNRSATQRSSSANGGVNQTQGES